LSKQGRLDEGIAEFREALRLKPDFVEAQKDLDWVLTQKKALEHASTPGEAVTRRTRGMRRTRDFFSRNSRRG